MCHRALATRTGPDIPMMRRADFLSGVAELVLAIALVLFGSLGLILVSTVLLAVGSSGTALHVSQSTVLPICHLPSAMGKGGPASPPPLMVSRWLCGHTPAPAKTEMSSPDRVSLLARVML